MFDKAIVDIDRNNRQNVIHLINFSIHGAIPVSLLIFILYN